MAITTGQARAQIVHDLGAATDRIALAVASLGAAYELLDELTADRLEADLFRPVQRALGRAKRTNAEFAARHRLTVRDGTEPSPGLPSQGVNAFVNGAVVAATDASRLIAELQDSMLPIEFGDPELRSGLADARELVDQLPAAARDFLRTLGR
ncbi:MAG: hypothetical protein ACRDLO_12765 [Solirubrobacterales bacterium]